MAEASFRITAAGRRDEQHLLAIVRSEKLVRAWPEHDVRMPRARASSCTWESTLPSPWVRIPAAGSRSAGVSGSATISLRVKPPGFGETRSVASARPGLSARTSASRGVPKKSCFTRAPPAAKSSRRRAILA
jgi:hypothetical protein